MVSGRQEGPGKADKATEAPGAAGMPGDPPAGAAIPAAPAEGATVEVPVGLDEAGAWTGWTEVPADSADHWDKRQWRSSP